MRRKGGEEEEHTKGGRVRERRGGRGEERRKGRGEEEGARRGGRRREEYILFAVGYARRTTASHAISKVCDLRGKEGKGKRRRSVEGEGGERKERREERRGSYTVQ